MTDLGDSLDLGALRDALRWVIEHKSCSDFPKCWAAAPDAIKTAIRVAWGSDPWPH